ncbi:fido domain-containing protein [Mycena haematopus]|nr:fido domain-containing protein [Mycena haematopus]
MPVLPVGSHKLLTSYQRLETRPDFVQGEPVLYAKTQDVARFYEGILKSHPECAEMVYVKARLAISYSQLGAAGSAIELAQEIQAQLADMDIQDSAFDSILDGWETMLQEEAVNALASDISATTYQAWKATKDNHFPTHLFLPPGREALKSRWQSMSSQGSGKFRGLLIANAIETNHIESTFLITVDSAQDLIRHGVARGVMDTDHRSEIKEHAIIKSILNDTLAAYDILDLIVKGDYNLSPDKISEIHSKLLETARFHGQDYVPPGDTRTTTRHTVYVGTPAGRVKFCPYTLVDSELVAICRSANALMKNMTNPFAVASWLHLVLARCHPFDDGNGRVARLVASIPLLFAGYPPISISLGQRTVYLQAINEMLTAAQAYNGNHVPFIQCIFDGMEEAIERVEELKD